MVVGYIKQNAIFSNYLQDYFKQGVSAFTPNPASEIILPIRVDSVKRVLATEKALTISYISGVDVKIQTTPIGQDENKTPVPPGDGTPEGFRQLFLTWCSNILRGIPQPRFDQICESYFYNETSSFNKGSTFLQMSVIIQGTNVTDNPAFSYKKMLRFYRKAFNGYYSPITLADSVMLGETTQWASFGGAGTGKFKWIENNGSDQEITYTIPSELQANLSYDYIAGFGATTNVQALSDSVQIDGPLAKIALNAMTAVNFQNTGIVGQGPGIEWTFTYANGNTATIFLEYVSYAEGGIYNGSPAGVSRLLLKKPSNKSLPPNWEDFAYTNSGFGEVITNLTGPYLDSPITGDDLFAAQLMNKITSTRNGTNPVETFIAPDGFDITSL